jgi:hypothetical protein
MSASAEPSFEQLRAAFDQQWREMSRFQQFPFGDTWPRHTSRTIMPSFPLPLFPTVSANIQSFSAETKMVSNNGNTFGYSRQSTRQNQQPPAVQERVWQTGPHMTQPTIVQRYIAPSPATIPPPPVVKQLK